MEEDDGRYSIDWDNEVYDIIYDSIGDKLEDSMKESVKLVIAVKRITENGKTYQTISLGGEEFHRKEIEE